MTIHGDIERFFWMAKARRLGRPPVGDLRAAIADPRARLKSIDNPFLRSDHRHWLWQIGAFVGPLTEHTSAELRIASAGRRVAMAGICAEAGYTTKAALLIDEVGRATFDKRRYPGLTRSLAPLRPWVRDRYAPELAAIARFERQTGTFERLVRQNARSLCIVGNSNAELGKNRGEEIDCHGLVIRFNNYATDPRFTRDYGTKSDIWVRVPRFSTVWRRDGQPFRLVVFPGPIYWRMVNAQDLILDLDASGQVGEALPSRLHHDMVGMLGSPPSSGFAVLYWVYRILGSLSGVTLMGFTMTDQTAGLQHYYTDERRRVQPSHNWAAEREALDRLLASEL